MSTFEDSEISHTETSGYEHDQVVDMNNTSVKDDGADNQPPPAVDVTTPTKGSPTPPVRILTREKSSPVAPPTPSTPKTPMTQEGIRYKTLFEELKMRYRTKQEEIKQLKEERGKSEKETNELRDLVAAFKKQNERLVQQCGDLTVQKQSEVKLTRRLSEEDFKTRSKSKKAKAPEDELKCENHNCVNTNEDTLIKCHACSKWICETCSEARIAKLKPIMKNCDTLFFACRDCVKSSDNSGIVVNTVIDGEKKTERSNTKTPDELVSSMETILKDHVSQIETKIDKMIEKKLEVIMPAVAADGSPEQQGVSTKGVLKVPEELRKIMQDAKNDDKVEENEQAKRAPNFIIHGAGEFGDDEESMKKLDNEYIGDILKHLGLAAKPDSVIRIGDPKKSNSRPIKVTMRTKVDKQSVMSRLNRLKGTEENFGKISITDDFTQSEREMIKNWSTKAKAKSTADKEYVYKVRGDPKNGMRLVRFKRN